MTKRCRECGGVVERLWSRGRCYFCSIKSYSQKPRTTSFPPKKTSPKKELDLVFGNYIKQRNITLSGGVFCFTCLREFTLSEIEAGHFIDRGCMRFRWDERNVFPQCVGDNRFKDGCLDIYEQHLNMIYGEGFAQTMREQARSVRRYYPNEIRDMITYYKALTKELVVDPRIGAVTENGRILWRDGKDSYICLDDGKLKLV